MGHRGTLLSQSSRCKTLSVLSKSPLVQLRAYATEQQDAPKKYEGPLDIAILGGGITGLTAAWRLSRISKDARITLYESKSSLGGWLRSNWHSVAKGKILFEAGPRTLRPAGASGLLMLLVIRLLKLQDEVLTCSKDSAAARNRYVYYPDHLVRMPGPGMSFGDIYHFLFREELSKGLATSLLKEWLIEESANPVNTAGVGWVGQDKSVSAMLTDRMGPGVADLASAVFHGIYAGDIDKLSMNALLPQQDYQIKNYKGIINGSLRSWYESAINERKEMLLDDIWLINAIRDGWGPMEDDLTERMRIIQNSSVFSFRQGMHTLARTMASEIKNCPRVTIKLKTSVKSLRVKSEGEAGVVVETNNDRTRRFTHAISTISSKALDSLLLTKGSQRTEEQRLLHECLTHNGSVTVMVVNLYYSTPGLVPVQGFGYLIPRHIPLEQNPECGLGVVFDSDAIQGQDTTEGTKLTVMMGGHWWDGWSKLPTEAEGQANAQALLKRHLGITEKPTLVQVSLQPDCIPQYFVKHNARMQTLDSILSGPTFRNRLLVAGSSYTGVGVNDCVRNGWNVAGLLKHGEPATGLERISKLGWAFVPKASSEFKI